MSTRRKLSVIKEANKRLETRFLNEQIVTNTTQLVKDIVSFFWDMNIIPGPIDATTFLYDLYKSKNPIQTIKDFVRGRIPSPGENWKKIEISMDKVGKDISNFKNLLYNEFKNRLKL